MVVSASSLTWMIGITEARAVTVLLLSVSLRFNVFAVSTLVKTFEIKSVVSMSTLLWVSVYSVSTSSAIDLKKS